MDILQIIANIAQIFSVLWTITFGSYAIHEILAKRSQSAVPSRIKLPKINVRAFSVITIIILLFAIFVRVITWTPVFYPPSGSLPPGQQHATGTASTLSPPSTTPSNQPVPPSTTPSYQPNQIIYHYQPSDWAEWTASAEWKSIPTTAEFGSDGTDDGSSSFKTFTAWAPGLQLPEDYAVEAQVTLVKITGFSGEFEEGIMVRGDGRTSGYEAGLAAPMLVSDDLCEESEITAEAIIAEVTSYQMPLCSAHDFSVQRATDPTILKGSHFSFDKNQHTYRVEVRGNHITFSIDGQKILETTDNTFLSAGQVGFRAIFADINVTSFKVIAL